MFRVRQTRISIVDYPKRDGCIATAAGRWPVARSAPAARTACTLGDFIIREGEFFIFFFPLELQVLANFRCLRLSPSLLFLRNFKLPQRNSFPLEIYFCFFVLNSTQNVPGRTAFSSLRVALTISTQLLWDTWNFTLFFFFEATIVRRKYNWHDLTMPRFQLGASVSYLVQNNGSQKISRFIDHNRGRHSSSIFLNHSIDDISSATIRLHHCTAQLTNNVHESTNLLGSCWKF